MFKDKLEDWAWYIIKRTVNNYSVGTYDPRRKSFAVIGGSYIPIEAVDSYLKTDIEALFQEAEAKSNV